MRALFFWLAGLTLPSLLPHLPDWHLVAALAVMLCPWRRVGPKTWRQGCLLAITFLLALAWSLWRAESRLAEAQALGPAGTAVEVVGTVRGLPDPGEFGVRFALEVEQVLEGPAGMPRRVLVSDYRGGHWPAGSRWQLKLRMRPVAASANPYGFDAERWMWSEGWLATATVRKGALRLADAADGQSFIDRLRDRVRQRFLHVLEGSAAAGLLGALTVGAQGDLPSSAWRDFAATGTSHLVSISGLHITLAAGWVGWLTARLVRRFPPPGVAPRTVVVVAAWIAALMYALLAGFSVPTQRSVLMLGVAVVLLLLRRPLPPLRLWAIALAAVLTADPFAVLAPGVWLSFGLVAVLIWSGQAVVGLPWWRRGLQAQWAVTVASVPLLAGWFGQLPLVSPLANALAIPFATFLLTPLALLAAAVPAEGLTVLAGWLAEQGLWGLHQLARLPTWPVPGLPAPLWLALLAGAVWAVLPAGWTARLWAAVLWLPVFLWRPPAPLPGTMQVTVLDVGQGLSVLVRTARHALLYDTGAGEASRVVVPQLQGLGLSRLDTLLLSHHDSDHDGAAASLLAAFPVRQLWGAQTASAPGQPMTRCVAGQTWQWDGVRFEVLWPPAVGGASDDNAHSCVVRVVGRTGAVLLPGDAPAAVEATLVARHGPALASTVLVVGHHGSRTATSGVWLEAVRPRLAIISAGALNRYRHPHPDVLGRLAAHGVAVVRTDCQGMLTLTLEAGGPVVEGYRDRAARYWRRHCPR